MSIDTELVNAEDVALCDESVETDVVMLSGESVKKIDASLDGELLDTDDIPLWNKELAKIMSPWDFYCLHHKGVTRGRLQIADNLLRRYMADDGSLELVPVTYSPDYKTRWNKEFAKTIAPLDYCNKVHPDIIRKELYRADRNLYNRLLRDNLIDKIPYCRIKDSQEDIPLDISS